MASEKTEQPTKHKIDKAREEGQVPVSRDFGHLAMLLAMGEMAFLTETYWREALESLVLLSIKYIGQPFLPAYGEMIASARLLFGVTIMACFVVGVVIAFAANWGQFGPLISTKALKFSFDKLNPVNTIKQTFSQKKLVELLMTTGKAILIGVVMYVLIRGELNNIIQLAAGGSPHISYEGFVTILRNAFHIIVGLFLAISLIDVAIQRILHIKSLRMDMEEIKKEHKENEGDPLIKGMRKQIAWAQAMSDPVKATEKADAVVVNPTHFAVSLFYDPEDRGTVPVVLAKGKDLIAQRMIDRARECGIPVVRHVWLARTLYATCQTMSFIPKSSYESVAHVYAVVMELNKLDEDERTFELESEGKPPESHAGGDDSAHPRDGG